MPLGRFIICCLSLTLPAFAQLDSPTLRAKYGPPLNRETFHVPPGFDLIVDYGAGNQACMLKVPALMPATGSKATMYDFLLDLVPLSMRGKEVRRMSMQMGLMSVTTVDYEHISISEAPSDNTITVTFKSNDCQTANRSSIASPQPLAPSPEKR
jgi:hypothetical protein